MAEVRERVEAELESIERVIAELPGDDSLPNLSSLELLLLFKIFTMA